MKFILFVLFSTYTGYTFAQAKKADVDPPKVVTVLPNKSPKKWTYDIREDILKGIRTNAIVDSLANIPLNEVYLMSIGVSFDISGGIDSVYFSRVMGDKLKAFLGLLELLQKRIVNSI